MRQLCLTLPLLLVLSSLDSAASEAATAISPKILQDMVRTTEAHFELPAVERVDEGNIPIPAAIAYGSGGCFAGFFRNDDLEKLRFDCIPGTERLALSTVYADGVEQPKETMVVLELIPSFAIGRCAECDTIGRDLREKLKSIKVDATIIRAEIKYR